MQIIKDQSCLACFSDATDGDLSFYLENKQKTKEQWCELEIVKRHNLEMPAWLYQIHGNKIKTLTDYSFNEPVDKADGLITDKTGIPIGIFSADCLPVLLWSDKAIGAVHAGWRGSLENIAGKAVKKMVEVFDVDTEKISVALGPCIGVCCLELGDEIYRDFIKKDERYHKFFKRKEKWHLNLQALNKFQLIEAGVSEEKIKISEKCTFCRKKDFFSFRRQKRRNGSMFSFVVRFKQNDKC
jgi:hypothetical protein